MSSSRPRRSGRLAKGVNKMDIDSERGPVEVKNERRVQKGGETSLVEEWTEKSRKGADKGVGKKAERIQRGRTVDGDGKKAARRKEGVRSDRRGHVEEGQDSQGKGKGGKRARTDRDGESNDDPVSTASKGRKNEKGAKVDRDRGSNEGPVSTASKEKKKKSKGRLEDVEDAWIEVIAERCKKYRDIFLGAHVSAAGGPATALVRAAEMGATAVAFFPRPHRTWNSAALSDEDVRLFHEAMKTCAYTPDRIVPHGSYLINCASTDETIRAISIKTLVEEVSRCERLGLHLYNFHPGSATGSKSSNTAKDPSNHRARALELVADAINQVHAQTSTVVILVENMCGQGNTVGGTFEELWGIIDHVVDKSRVGVCFDTCHAFASGYDISTAKGFDQTMHAFDKIIGLKYLRAVHLNDSKSALNSHRDLHESIGKGHVGMEAFRFLINDPRFRNVPCILETPAPDRNDRRPQHASEVELLLSLTST